MKEFEPDSIANEIFYLFAIPEFELHEVTPFQGFAFGLFEVGQMLIDLPTLPADIIEMTMDLPDRLARRRAGLAGWLWSPVGINSLLKAGKPTPQRPFLVVFSGDATVGKQVATWRRELSIKPLHVSVSPIGGAIQPHELTIERLQNYCRTALRQAKDARRRIDVSEALRMVSEWETLPDQQIALEHHSHNVTMPNEIVLRSAGIWRTGGVRLDRSPHDHYVEGIRASAQAVIDLRKSTGNRPVYRIGPPQPDLILLAPSMHVQAGELMSGIELPAASLRAFRALERQRGYSLQMRGELAEIPDIGNIMGLRGAELRITSNAVAIRAASTLAATVRLPPAINRSGGVVGQLSRFLRQHENPPPIKTARVFKAVQDSLIATLPQPHLELIRASKSGIKIVGEAPLEWLPIDDVPLGIAKDVSRIGTTPGNLLIEQLRHRPPIFLRPQTFKSYEVISTLEQGDSIARYMPQALSRLPKMTRSKISGRTTFAFSVEQFVEAVNNCRSPLLIIDGHGVHPEHPNIGGLIIGGKPVDIWGLFGLIRRIPPIVVLSACDTHPFDRSHATVANGFLRCGATAVLATVLPVRAPDAAVFVTRLLHRAISYSAAVNGVGRAVPWTNIVGGALRMQLASDVVHALASRGLLSADAMHRAQFAANRDINPPRKYDDWLPRLRDRCMEAGGFDRETWDLVYPDIVAGSDAIRYVHVGNPESLIVADERVLIRTVEDATGTA